MKSRILSLFLACLMVLSLVPALFLVTTAEDVAFSSSFIEEAQAGKITYDKEAATVSYNGAWQAMILNKNGSAFEPILLDRLNPIVEANWAITETAHTGISTNRWSQWWWGSLPGSGVMSLSDYSFGFSNPQGIQGYQYTVAEDGEFAVTAEIENFTAPGEGMSYYFCVMIDGNMVWPMYGASYDYTTAYGFFTDEVGAWYRVTSATTKEELNEALSSMKAIVNGGAKVQFCFRYAGTEYKDGTRALATPKVTAKVATPEDVTYYVAVREKFSVLYTVKAEGTTAVLPEYTGTSIFLGWDLDGDGMVDAQPGSSINAASYAQNGVMNVDAVTVGSSAFYDNLPTLDAERVAVFRGGWEIGVFSVSENTFMPFLAPADSYNIITLNGNVWGKQGGGMYAAGKIAYSGNDLAGDYRSQINYTAMYNGDVTLDFAQLTLRREGAKAPNNISYSFTILINGEKVWPTDADYRTMTSPDVYEEPTCGWDALDAIHEAGFPLSLSVNKGDVISVRTMQDNTDNWMAHINPVVTYTNLKETPLAAGSSISIGSDLSLHMLVQVVGKQEDSTVGLEYWLTNPTADQLAAGGTKLEGKLDDASDFYQFTYTGLSAKQMTEEVYARPYVENNGTVIYGTVSTFSIKAYAEKAYGRSAELDKVLAALLTYGTNAQTLFGYNTDNFANSFVPDEDRPGAYTGDLNDIYNNEDGANKIKSVSLLLDCELGFKFMIDSVEGATTYELEVADNADFENSEKIPMTAVWEGREQKAIVKIGYGELDRAFYVRAVVDGEAGAVLTYNLDSYFNRIQANCEDGLYFTLSALIALDRALQEYMA